MVSAIEAVIKYLLGNSGITTLCSTRIAPRHRYKSPDNAWSIDDAAIAVRQDGGPNQQYIGEYFGRLEFRIYGKTNAIADDVYRALVAVQRGFDGRAVVTLSSTPTVRKAVINLFNLVSAPTELFDQELGIPYFMVFGEIRVAETEV